LDIKCQNAGTPEYYAMGLIDQIMIRAKDSLIYKEFVKNKGYAGGAGGGYQFGPWEYVQLQRPM
jgi:hypothetical protein